MPDLQKKFQNLAKWEDASKSSKISVFFCIVSVLLSQGPVETGSFLHGAQPFYGSDDQSMRFTCTLLTHGRQAKKSWSNESNNRLTQDDARSN